MPDIESAHKKVVEAEGALALARDARREQIRLALTDGASLREIARAVGLTHEAVRKIAR